MAYLLCIMTFTKAECVKIQTTYMSTALQKMGFMGTTKRALVFGPEEYGGLGITDLWTEQGIQHVTLLLGHLRNWGEAGMLLMLGIEWMVLTIGCPEEIFSYPIDKIQKYVPWNWILCTWEFLMSINVMVDLKDGWTLKPQCDQDHFIMQDMAANLNLKPAELKCMNACRMYLQVVTLADIVDGSGKKVLPEFLKGWHQHDRRSVYEWPNQETPNKMTWKRWARNIQKLYLKPYTKHGEL
jgi:hypothetical protein